uniref:Epididymal sperm protein E n=1 Tax=Sepia officinalis TaxID=6610 RepID=SPE_SEPOF|nr:RecName: Full=Epididymal sperm protein E [Sepia officinalis]AAB30187.1 protein E=zinc finger [Sepia officinalis=cuttlefishes, epididymal sperm nuclei, Peptide, 51 aa] [Sepia officinalis]
ARSFSSYCVRCRRKTPSFNSKTVTFRNKRRAIRSHCAYCQVKKFRIIGHGG